MSRCKNNMILLVKVSIPYALKFSRDETFAVFAVRKTTANSLKKDKTSSGEVYSLLTLRAW